MHKKMLLFDIDGTLLMTGGAGKTSFDQTFYKIFGVREAWGDLCPDGKCDSMIIEEIMHKKLGRKSTPEEYERIREGYCSNFEVAIWKSAAFRLLPGVEKLLNVLSGREDLLLGVATGNFEKTAILKLKRAGLDGHFSFGGYGSDAGNRVELTRRAYLRGLALAAENIPPHRVTVIGDTRHDINAGKSLGFRTIGVASNREATDELRTFAPDLVLPDLNRLEDFLGALDV